MATIGAIRKEYPWPENLFHAVQEASVFEVDDTVVFYPDGVSAALGMITLEEKAAIEDYFKYGKTLMEIGKSCDRSPERIRQRLVQALRKLRHPSRFNLFTALKRDNYDDIVQKISILKEDLLKISNRIYELEKIVVSGENKSAKSCDTKDQFIPFVLMDLDSLGISTRALNALRRKGISNVEQLLLLSRQDLVNTRNLGNDSIAEIIVKVNEKTGYILGPNLKDRFVLKE